MQERGQVPKMDPRARRKWELMTSISGNRNDQGIRHVFELMDICLQEIREVNDNCTVKRHIENRGRIDVYKWLMEVITMDFSVLKK
jgi:arabinogalactan endo-1,4-beta-galactosidase